MPQIKPHPEHVPQDYPLPCVHFGGTGRASLVEMYQTALHTAEELHYQLRQPLHGRDYYPLEAGAFIRASEALGYHMQALGEIRSYLEKHLIHCHEVPGQGRSAA